MATPEEWAIRYGDTLCPKKEDQSDYMPPHNGEPACGPCLEAIVRTAVAEEREACIKVAEAKADRIRTKAIDWPHGAAAIGENVALEIAARIRERSV